MQRIRKGDLVQVITGDDRGKQGKVIAIKDEGRRVRVEKVRLQKRHLKPGRKGARAGGIIEQEGFIASSNVLLVDRSASKPARTRIDVRDGERVRVFTGSGETVPEAPRS